MSLLADEDCEYGDKWGLHENRIPVRRLSILDEAGRPIRRGNEGDRHEDGASGDGDDSSHYHWEALLRFPNAPLYITHVAKPPMYQFAEEDAWDNYHTMRIVGVGEAPSARIKHVYLLHNGLNETWDLTFHYRLAAWILNGRSDAICIIRPLPGHLTRFPFDGFFSETPLDGYLRDPMDLFRQFLRYMLETQWLLSTLVLHPPTEAVAGGRLLTHNKCGNTTVCGDSLAERIAAEWGAVFDFNESRENKAEDANRPQYSRLRATASGISESVADLLSVLGRQTDNDDAASSEASEPRIHTVGYSMGGFMAQAAFFAWPHVISSCTSLFAGGALRDLAPTDFADPEEWQTVLHALRYEFDSALADGLLAPPKRDERERIAGLVPQDFRYLKRVFYEVFLQYYRGGYSSRLAEFSRRLLCILGGDDPIVRIKNVLDAGPPEGMTLFQIADMSHFPGGTARKTPDRQAIEREQRAFWMPEIGRVIARFSAQAEVERKRDSKYIPRFAQRIKPLSGTPPHRTFPPEEERLDDQAFEHTVDEIIALVENPESGWLLIGRNEIAPVFLDVHGFQTHASALHHSEELIARYVSELQVRAEKLENIADRTTVLIPDKSQEWFTTPDLRQKLFSRSETPGAANLQDEAELCAMYQRFIDEWYASGAIRLVPGGEYTSDRLAGIGQAEAKRLKVEKLSLTMLPDVWIGLSAHFCTELRGRSGSESRDKNEKAIVDWATNLCKEDKEADELLKSAVRNQTIVALKVSAAEFNPRYRGHTLAIRGVERALRHWALAYSTAQPTTAVVEPTDLTSAG
jgi:hypothetical protein